MWLQNIPKGQFDETQTKDAKIQKYWLTMPDQVNNFAKPRIASTELGNPASNQILHTVGFAA